ncbi:Gfo/Idh/MocA family oxidoreductase [Sphingobacterium sp. SRCM116780]|uniref:Gfo/Idh/MocA family oxidoreductase n=1 Tax=Sphingobacterium sp. SRCM116780 TaxID=2907623 RepID=UPI001F3E753D|nr:Gfo/Idh/MocA family oxidoreductase [Sphingobacterium sp. SRCM116780]UIR57042.1 Gfo/Idh/MocA family oxidoreductase [Sphingobacterium sp. SRCM116780]
MKTKIKILVVGCGNMGASHARAYHELEGFEIVGLVSRGNSKTILNATLQSSYAEFDDYEQALSLTKPDAVCIATYPDTHESYAIKAFQSGAHVFIEKPLADTVLGAQNVISAASKYNKKLVVGYILRYHPSWEKFIDISRSLGTPLVMRMNLNQQSHGFMWDVHRNLMESLSPIVDCGVHYIDVMCQMTDAKPIQVSAIGARLSSDIPDGNYNYGQLQLHFDDGSVGWYEAGWGPMVSQTAFFVKDVFGPKGSVSIVPSKAVQEGASDSVEAHTKTESLRVHYADIDKNNEFVKADEWIHLEDEPTHQDLCNREQLFFQKAILENLDLKKQADDALNSLRIAFACDEAVKTKKTIDL